MSYSIYLRGSYSPCPTCGHAKEEENPQLPNPTYNLAPIFNLAIQREIPDSDLPRGLRRLDGRKAIDTIDLLREAYWRMNDPKLHSAFIALEPPNGWGDLPGAIRVISKLIDAAEKYPNRTWEIL